MELDWRDEKSPDESKREAEQHTSPHMRLCIGEECNRSLVLWSNNDNSDAASFLVFLRLLLSSSS